MKLEDFKAGDVIVLKFKYIRKTEERSAEVTELNYKGNGLVSYIGCQRDGFMEAGSGAFDPVKIGTKPYGLVEVYKVGDHGPLKQWRTNHFGPRPGDPGYDLMC